MTATYNQSYGAGTSKFFPNGIDGWHLVNQTPNKTLANDHITRDSDGHYITTSRRVGGKRTAHTETWEPDGDASELDALEIGDIADDKCIESASLQCTGSDRPKLTLAGHIHEQKEDDACKHIGDTYECEFELPTGCYGAVNPFPDAGINTILDYEITSSTQTFSINHQDEPGQTGEFLTGVSRGVTRTGHMELTTANKVTLGAGDNGWKIMSVSEPTTNESVAKITVDGTMYISTASISPSSTSASNDASDSGSGSSST